MPETDDGSDRPVDDERAPVFEREDRDSVAEARLNERDLAEDQDESARARDMTPDQVAEMRLASDGEDGLRNPTGENEDLDEVNDRLGSDDGSDTKADQRSVAGQTEGTRDREMDRAVENVAERLRGVEALGSDRWRAADGLERQRALRSANAILADSFGEPSSDVVFYPENGPYAKLLGDKLPYVTDGHVNVLPDGEIGYITLDDRFLDPTRCTEPSEALKALCHEYRHVYQLDDAARREENVAPNAERPNETTNPAYVEPKQDFDAYQNQSVERDSRTFAEAICRAVYRG
jgi:hypothetical protein